MSPFPFKAKCTCCHRFVSKAWIMLSKWPLSVLKCIFRQQNLFLAKKKNVANIGFFRLSPIEWHKLFRNNNQQKETVKKFLTSYKFNQMIFEWGFFIGKTHIFQTKLWKSIGKVVSRDLSIIIRTLQIASVLFWF